MTSKGPIPGVVAVANGHFAQQHRADTLAATMDDLWIDVGASTAAEVAQAGISVLDPLTINRPAWTFEGFAAGPAAGARAGCAALATAANGSLSTSETIFVISAQRSYSWLGLSQLLARLGRIQSLVLIGDGSDGTAVAGRGGRGGGRGGAPAGARSDSVRTITPRVRYARTMVETIRSSDARELLTQVIEAAGVTLPHGPMWVSIGGDTARSLSRRAGTIGEIERQWMALADLPGVAGHEAPVRAAILAALPAWARSRAVVDSMGNIVVAMGPERDSVAFIAHMDEVGFEVASILPDGRVTLRLAGWCRCSVLGRNAGLPAP